MLFVGTHHELKLVENVGTYIRDVVVECHMCAPPTNVTCDVKCNNMYNPVCGSDGITYNNKCKLKKAKVTTQLHPFNLLSFKTYQIILCGECLFLHSSLKLKLITCIGMQQN